MSASSGEGDLPPYGFVPGHRPHPTQHPDGHSYGAHPAIPAALDPRKWDESRTYLRAFQLFDHGYYWEAHEAWEQLWIAAGRQGPVGALLKGLIKLAAAGVKVRQGVHHQVPLFGARAAAHFRQAHQLCGQEQLAGLRFADLLAFCAYLEREGAGLQGEVDLAVEVVFTETLSPPPTV